MKRGLNEEVLNRLTPEQRRPLELNDLIKEAKLENLKKDSVLRDLEIRKKKGEFLSPDEIKQFLLTVSTAQNAVLNRWIGELPSRLVGKAIGEIEVELKKALQEVCAIFKTDLKEWK